MIGEPTVATKMLCVAVSAGFGDKIELSSPGGGKGATRPTLNICTSV